MGGVDCGEDSDFEKPKKRSRSSSQKLKKKEDRRTAGVGGALGTTAVEVTIVRSPSKPVQMSIARARGGSTGIHYALGIWKHSGSGAIDQRTLYEMNRLDNECCRNIHASMGGHGMVTVDTARTGNTIGTAAMRKYDITTL